jgi:heme exporter protein A
MAAMNASVLCGRDVGVWRGERCLFEALDFTLPPGRLALVLGANGAGKTTLLRVLAGLALPTIGTVTWDERAVAALYPEQRTQIAYRGHLDGLKKDLTVRENLVVQSSIWGGGPVADALLAELTLDRAANVRARYLSAGQRRRAALALLRYAGARLWLLDEPLTNLDAAGRALIAGWLEDHLAGGGSAVVATHQPDDFAPPRGSLVIEL